MDEEKVGPHEPDLAIVEVDGRINIFAPGTGQAFMLNETASSIWQLAGGELSASEIVARVADLYDVPAETVRKQVLATLRRFRADNLLVPPD